MNSALRKLVSGQMPQITGILTCSIASGIVSSRSRSNTGWVTTYSAPGLHFPLEAPKFLVHVQRARIGADADQQSRLRTHRIAADIQARDSDY